MDSTPSPKKSTLSEPRFRLKSASRLARAAAGDAREISPLSLDLPPYFPARVPPSPPSKSIQELLLLSPSPPNRSSSKPPPPPLDHIEAAVASEEPSPQPRRCKSCRTSQLGCSSPRNARRTRRRVESEVVREERDSGFGEEIGKARKRRQSGRTKKEKLILAPSVVASPKLEFDAGEGRNLDLIGQQLSDLIMWKHVSKSSLWFGIGSVCFLSSCFATGINFSIFSVISRLGLLFLGVSFFSNSYCQRGNIGNQVEYYRLKEEDVLRLGRIILPAANLMISVARQLFSGKPSMTLKVAPFLLLGAEFGHLITLWRLCAVSFIVSFSVPKLYTCYSSQINKQVEHLRERVLEAWRGCSHKKIVLASAATAFWNLFTIKARLFAVFISLVIFRCYKQLPDAKPEEVEGTGYSGRKTQF